MDKTARFKAKIQNLPQGLRKIHMPYDRQPLLTGTLVMVLFFATMTTVSAKTVEDRNITSAIEFELMFNEMVDVNAVDVSTAKGITTLSGTVRNILAKDQAERIAESIVGVRSVINRLTVNPPARPDSEIRIAVENALANNPATESYDVDTAVANKAVTLTGTVQSWQERKLSETVAKGVKGVAAVNNKIAIEYRAARSDYEIERDIAQRLKYDVLVDDALIKVKVEDAEASLSGTVGSSAEKRRARLDAWVDGVKTVDAAGLEVEWWARDTMRRKDLYQSIDDAKIKQAVQDAFLYDPRVFSFNPVVTVDDGTVTLSGVVDNLRAKIAAEQDAKNTFGVRRVKNHLKVRPEKVPANKVLKKRITGALANDPYVESYEINVSVLDGKVYLYGTVNTSFEKSRAQYLAESVRGTVHVYNNIDFHHAWVWKPDREIRDNVKEQLFWSPFVDEEQVSVSVNNGVVTLSGTVETWGEKQDAGENAFEAGAKDVHNNLKVVNYFFGPYPRGYFNHMFPHTGYYPWY